MSKQRYNVQCKTCPWKVSTDPERDIPNGYCTTKHENLSATIQSGVEAFLSRAPMRIMACHYSDTGSERPCAGWLHNQIGEGNNIGARFAVMTGRFLPPKVSGEQHATFEDTVPKRSR